jgi:nitroreductase
MGDFFHIPNTRKSDYPIDPLFTTRWSPRAFDGAPMSDPELLTLLEAARWAPSAQNAQEWRFAYALRGDELWQPLLESLNTKNQTWASNASALLAVASSISSLPKVGTTPVPNPSHAFDAGAAWAHLALQATLSGWHVHAMGGFNPETAAKAIHLPSHHVLHCVVAVGKRGDPANLPDGLREREAPNGRKHLSEIAVRGAFTVGQT